MSYDCHLIVVPARIRLGYNFNIGNIRKSMLMLVKSLRESHNWSQQQLAQLSGLNVRTIQRVEKGESVGLETLKSLAAVFEIDVSVLKEANTKSADVNNTDKTKDNVNDLAELEEIVEAKVKSIKEFYILALFLFGIFILFFVPNYNNGENLGSLIAVAVCFAMIIGSHAITVFQPFGEKWKKRKIKKYLEGYERKS